MDNNTASVEYIVLTVEQAAERLNIGRTLMYSLVSSGEVESVLIGRLRRIPLDALTRYVHKLSSATPNPEVA
ncbi:excisionase family DNA binding protein [Saccharothrix coeruleofusca]|uniref:excisionase family DNA-binding protein n=1 Tax=Saccharothrix coeruleofusca TaxID=33919 RepID=UPI001FD4099C|nr:excisionase family DNA-binding protein [Saccharothrix coeruleofusca]MBP2340195.1 excisionase family DNA binding protein [Saccharothrix coeruleofusca]